MNYLYIIATQAIQAGGLPKPSPDSGAIQSALGVVFALIGALALLMITISGLRYILSGGNPEKTAKAKKGILFAVAGVAVAIAGESIVVFVVRRI